MFDLQKKHDAIIARNAFYATSFDPEKRSKDFADDYLSFAESIIRFCQAHEIDPETTINRHFTLTMNYLNAHARCLSSMITGPANFPVARNKRNLEQADNRLSELRWFMDNYQKRLIKSITPKETPDDQKAKWIAQIAELQAKQDMMKDVNKMIRNGQKTDAEQKYNIKIEKDFLGNEGFGQYKLTNNLATIKRLQAQVAKIDETREQKAETNFDFPGGRVEFDASEIRYNIFFDKIPDIEMRSAIKSRGFKWSPTRSAWTRGAKTLNIEVLKSTLSDKNAIQTQA